MFKDVGSLRSRSVIPSVVVCFVSQVCLFALASARELPAGSEGDSPGLLRVLTVTTNVSSPEFQVFNQSFYAKNALEPQMELLVAVAPPDAFRELGWKGKILYVQPLLKNLPIEDVVLLADSNDLIWLPCGRDLRTAFHDFHSDVILNSENFQFPDHWKEPFFPDIEDMYPDKPWPSDYAKSHYFERKYLNAGVIMGRVGILQDIIGRMFWEYGYADTQFDDQRFWTNIYLAQFWHSTARHRPSHASHTAKLDQHSQAKIAIDAGGLLAQYGTDMALDKVAGTRQSERYRFTACILHHSGGIGAYQPLHDIYRDEWSKQFPFVKKGGSTADHALA